MCMQAVDLANGPYVVCLCLISRANYDQLVGLGKQYGVDITSM